MVNSTIKPDFDSKTTVFSRERLVPLPPKSGKKKSAKKEDHPVSALKTTAGIEAFSGEWNEKHAAHLLRRCLFGATKAQLAETTERGLEATLDLLLADLEMPSPPINWFYQDDSRVPIGESWIDTEFINEPEIINYQRASLYSWSLGTLWSQPFSLREKMYLFWFNHFVTQFEVVQEPHIMYFYMELLLRNALGNFRELAKDVTVSSAMLIYLNGNGNNKEAPNENYARELFELFTIGKGPTIGEGNYTNYSEQDVLAAARVLTGWYITIEPFRVNFAPQIHDTGDKQFSEAFDNHVISNNGANEYKDLVDMIFGKEETARFICRKLYRWFVYYGIDDSIEQSIIEALAQTLIESDFEIKPVLRQLFSSAHFFSDEAEGALIKNPIDYSLSVVKNLELDLLSGGNAAENMVATVYNNYLWFELYRELEGQQQALLNPPSVAGWPAYYQTPAFHRIWVNSVTLPMRNQFFKILLRSQGLNIDEQQFRIEPLKLVEQVSVPHDPNVLIDELSTLLFPQEITDSQKTYLKEALIPGLPDFEWTVEYFDYKNDPENEELRMAVDNKLRTMLDAMLSMAEFHLS